MEFIQGKHYYLDGRRLVFTALYHLNRGYCCKSVTRCRHCPYIPVSEDVMSNLKKNGIILFDNAKTTTLIAYYTGNQKRKKSLYNKALIYKSVKPIKAATEIIDNFDSSDFEYFDESKINEYQKSNLIIINQNEVVYETNSYFTK